MTTQYSFPSGLVSPHEIGEMTPVKTLEGLQPSKEKTGEAISDLLKLTKRLENEDILTDRKFFQKWFKVAKYYEGEHLGRFSEITGQWRSYTPQVGDPYYIFPEFRYHSDAITSQWVQSRPDLRVLPANDRDDTVAKARAASQILDYYEETILTEEFLQREGKLGQITGQMYRYTYWDPSKGREVPRYDFQPQPVQMAPGYYECQDCGKSGPLEELEAYEGMCPQCGSQQILTQDPQHAMVPMPQEMGNFPIGDICTECVPAFQVKFDRSSGEFALATYLRRRRVIRPEIIKELIPWWEPSATSGPSDDVGLRAERLLKQSTGQSSSRWVESRVDPASGVVVNQWWLAPCLYGWRKEEPVDVEFGGGQVIKAGERFIDHFPSGLYLLIIDGKIIDCRDEYLHDHWQHSPFIKVPTRAEGDGIEDLCEPQRQLNDLNSLIYTDAKANSAPPTVVNTTHGIDVNKISGKPHWIVPARVPPGESLDNSIRLLQGRALPGHLFSYIQGLQGSMQLYAKSFSAATGAPDIAQLGGVNTATGAQLMSTNAQAMRAPELALRAAGDVIWATQLLKLFRKNATDEHYIPLQGRYGVMEGSYFKGADIDEDFIISVKRRSWMPRNEMDRRADIMGFIQAGGLDPNMPRQVRDALAEAFSVEVQINNDLPDIRVARMRLDQMAQLFQQMQQMVPPEAIPMLLSEAVPIDPLSDNHMVQHEWWKDWKKTDEGIQAPEPLRQAADMKIIAHEQAMAVELQRQAVLQMSAMAPQMAHEQAAQEDQQQKDHENTMEREKQKQSFQSSKPKAKGK